MKRFVRWSVYLWTVAALVLLCGNVAKASELTIREGVYAGEDSLAGMTVTEADSMIRDKIAKMGSSFVTLVCADGNEVTVTADALGIAWSNPEIVWEAARIGTEGNVIQRYKALKDLEINPKVFEVELRFDIAAINDVLVEHCVQYDRKPQDASLTRVNDEFQITEGIVGYEIDVEHSIDVIHDYLQSSWDGGNCRIKLTVAEEQPRGTAADLAQVTDVLGSYTTDYSSSNSNRRGNVANGASKINGTLLFPGEIFSATDAVSPFTEENGYSLAGAYLNGKVVQSMGGGICQVSSTLYNAVLLAELEVIDRSPHSMIVTYVPASMDAAIAEDAGKDFRFRNNKDYPIYIEGYTKNKKITFNIYGKETRPADRKVTYESEVLETTPPTIDLITADPTKPIGYVTTEAAHVGCKARLWKVVKEGGKEVSREVINNSRYMVSPRSAVVGVATDEAWKYEEIMAAIGTYDLDHVRVVIGLLNSQ